MIDQEGTCRLGVRFHDRYICTTFHVVNSKGPMFLGLQSLRDLELVTLNLALKNISQAPPRLVRMLLKVKGYDFTVKCTPGRAVPIADCLSQVSPRPSKHLEGIDLNVHTTKECFNFSQTRIENTRVETLQGPLQIELAHMVMSGWPANWSSCPKCVLPFWNFRDEIGIEDEILLKSSPIIIPESLQKGILEKLHTAHQEIEKTRLRAHPVIYREGMNEDIEDFITNFKTYQKYQTIIPAETMHQHEIPTYLWQNVNADLYKMAGNEYLLVADQYSQSPFIYQLCSTSSVAVIKHIKAIFEGQDVLEILYMDNGTQFTSKEFVNFSTTYSFLHKISSPHYPKSNGFAERMVGVCKRILLKAQETGQDSYLAMMVYRATPMSSNLSSPIELLNGQQIRTWLIS